MPNERENYAGIVKRGVKTDEMSFKTVKLTIFSQDDVEDAKKSQRELLKNRIVRLSILRDS